MGIEILTRAGEAAAIILCGLACYALVSRLILRRVRGKAGGVAGIQPGVPSILYFTTPDCIPCKTIQRPALSMLRARLGDGLMVIEVDATQNPRMAQEWGVMSVPTTFIIDAEGCPRHINHGAVSAEKLFEQLERVRG
jgi:thiol-disulfide isomerase/thioredoxin